MRSCFDGQIRGLVQAADSWLVALPSLTVKRESVKRVPPGEAGNGNKRRRNSDSPENVAFRHRGAADDGGASGIAPKDVSSGRIQGKHGWQGRGGASHRRSIYDALRDGERAQIKRTVWISHLPYDLASRRVKGRP